jgi:EAL domain-containing protein (putative c-di-GMP-specific phosphodiesterase class I)
VARLTELCARFPASVDEPRRPARLRALVLDDDRQVLRIVAQVLEDAGFLVSPAAFPAEALRLLDSTRFDVAVCDLSMPGTDGLSFLETLRLRGELVPVIFLTGLPDTRSAIRAIELGAFRYLTKPFDHDELVAVARQAVAAAAPPAGPGTFDAIGASATVRQLDLVQAHFESALEGLWLAAQPILHAAEPANTFGYELALRSNDSRLRSPVQLHATAERLGATARLRERVQELTAAASDALPDATLFLPLHPRELADDALLAPEHPLAVRARRVVLVLSERVGLDSLSGLMARLATLRAAGFRIAVGDLGAGYASLTNLASLDPDVAKIDESLVRDIDTSPPKRSLVASITAACRDAGVLVVAEGVATRAELDTIAELGCDLAQGTFLGPPQRVGHSKEAVRQSLEDP